MNQPTAISLFSGIGAMDLAAAAAGFDIRAQVEIEPFCRKVLTKWQPLYWPNSEQHEDVNHVGRHNLYSVDLVFGGFPCQDISSAGAGQGIKEGTRSGLWFQFERIISELRPRFVLLENVAAITRRDGPLVIASLAALGYDAAWAVVPASAVGAPHQRERWFCIGVAHSYHSEQGRALYPGAGTLVGQSGLSAERQENAGQLRGNDQMLAHTDGERDTLDEFTRHNQADAAGSRQAVADTESQYHQRQFNAGDTDHGQAVSEGVGAGLFDRTASSRETVDDSNGTGLEGIGAGRSGQTLAESQRAGTAVGNPAEQGLPDGQRCRLAEDGTQGSAGLEPESERSSGAMENADSGRWGSRRGEQPGLGWQLAPDGAGEPVANADGRRGTRMGETTGDDDPLSILGRATYGIAVGMDRSRFPAPPGEPQFDWEASRTVGRGLPNRVARLKALGNAVVPAQVYPFFEAIFEAWKEQGNG